MPRPLTKGDYVLATKYRDGDPLDGWAVGFYASILRKADPRFLVVDEQGQQFRNNGFRRCERVSHALGDWYIHHMSQIQSLGLVEPVNIWRYRQARYRRVLEVEAL